MGRQRVPFRIETGIQPTREKIALMVAHCEDSSIQAATGGLLSPGLPSRHLCRGFLRAAVRQT